MSFTFLKSGSGQTIQFVASGSGATASCGFSTPGATIVSGAGAANMSNVGMTALVSVFQDDVANPWTLPMDFYFLGTNYGKNLNGGMGWCSNFVISFSLSGNDITWPASKPGVLLGNADRATNTFHYSPLQTSGAVQYVNCVMQGQNAYNDSQAFVVKYQYRLIRDNQYQYIEIRCATGPASQGTWRVVSGPPGGNVILATGAYVGTGASGVWRSTALGANWTWFANSYVTFA
jgi:hypothetical protein